MLTTDQARRVLGGTVVGSDGSKLGKIGQIFLDDRTGEPEWLTVNTGLFGTRESFVPLVEAAVEDDTVRVPYTKQQVNDAPNVDADRGHLDADEEVALYRHYGLRYSDHSDDLDPADESDHFEQAGHAGHAGHSDDFDRSGTAHSAADAPVGSDVSGRTTDDAMTRSEERLSTGVQRVVGRKARLRKWVETEVVHVPVTVRREKARLETVPITDAEAAQDATKAHAGHGGRPERDVHEPDGHQQDLHDGDLRRGDADPELVTGDQPEVVLWEERPVITTETVPVERVRLVTETVQEEATVAEQLRKERIELDEDLADVTDVTDDERSNRP